MSAIAGVVGTADRSLAQRMIAVLRHRGPDGTWHHSQPTVHLAAATLATTPHAAAAWPLRMTTPDERCLVFDGELTNARELRHELSQRGRTFATGTDAELVMQLYDEMGPDCVQDLRGVFALAVLDNAQIFLARDPLGARPLYYATASDGLFLFASEIKGILQHRGFTPRLNARAMADTSLLGYAVGTDTFVDGVCALAPGHTMRVACGDRPSAGQPRAWPRRAVTRDPAVTIEAAMPLLERALTDAVASAVASEGEIGLALSGGLDSTVLALLAREVRPRRLLTCTVAGEEGHPDLVCANAVARLVGSEHHPIVLGFEDFLAAIPACVAAEERPVSLFGVPFHALCRAMSARTNVCLLGEGADGPFGGSPEYLIPQDRSHWPGRFAALERIGLSPSDRARAIIDRFESCDSVESSIAWMFEFNWHEPLERWSMEFADRIGMSAGVQPRLPYIDDRVTEVIGRCPIDLLVRPKTRIGKYLLKRWSLERFGASPEIIDAALRTKHGINSAAVGLRGRLAGFCEQVLPDDYLSRHELGGCFDSKLQLLMFEMFEEIFLAHRGDSSAVRSVKDFIDARATRAAAPD
jgi:asparagine synthase (glutamine-hydrolysing)